MALHFSREEFATRQANAIQQLQARGLDGLLMFKQESMFYLTGYDTFGFCFFQCLYLGADGRIMLLTRAPDLRQAENTSLIEDIRIWVDGHGVNPAQQLRDVLQEFGCSGRKFGVEYDAYGLTAYNGMRVQAALDGFCALEDASDLVSGLRLIKSPAEIAFVRRAAELGDAALDEANRMSCAEGHILAAMQGAVFRGGGDYAGNEFIIGSGPDALLCRYFTGRKVLDSQDQMTLEFAGAYRHYHACLMRTIIIGEASDVQRDMHDTALEALQACRDALKPGRPIGEVFDAHAEVMDRRGYNHARMNACGYSLGAVFAPIWMDMPMLYNGNPIIAEPGMVFFLHMIMMDSDKGRAMAPGETVLVTEQGNERLSAASLDLVVR
jgi:Xaa-Pro dipeptidase